MKKILRNFTLSTIFAISAFMLGNLDTKAAASDVFYLDNTHSTVNYGDAHTPLLIDGWYCVLNPSTGKASIEGAQCTSTALVFPKAIEYNNQSFTVTDIMELPADSIFFEYFDKELYVNKNAVKTILVPDTVKEFGMQLHTWKNLKKVSLSKSVTKNLYLPHTNAKIVIDKANPKYKTYKNGVYSKTGTTLVATFGKQAAFSVKKDTKYIGTYAFEHYTTLKKLILPASLKKLGFAPFKTCKKLSSITLKCKKAPKLYKKLSFNGLKKSCKIYVKNTKVQKAIRRAGFKGKIIVK